MGNFTQQDIEDFKTNLRVWGRRLKVSTDMNDSAFVERVVKVLVPKFGLGRRAAIMAACLEAYQDSIPDKTERGFAAEATSGLIYVLRYGQNIGGNVNALLGKIAGEHESEEARSAIVGNFSLIRETALDAFAARNREASQPSIANSILSKARRVVKSGNESDEWPL